MQNSLKHTHKVIRRNIKPIAIKYIIKNGGFDSISIAKALLFQEFWAPITTSLGVKSQIPLKST